MRVPYPQFALGKSQNPNVMLQVSLRCIQGCERRKKPRCAQGLVAFSPSNPRVWDALPQWKRIPRPGFASCRIHVSSTDREDPNPAVVERAALPEAWSSWCSLAFEAPFGNGGWELTRDSCCGVRTCSFPSGKDSANSSSWKTEWKPLGCGMVWMDGLAHKQLMRALKCCTHEPPPCRATSGACCDSSSWFDGLEPPCWGFPAGNSVLEGFAVDVH